MPTFWTLGTSEPMTIPIGRVASSPRTTTQATVAQPAKPLLITSSKSRKLGTRITSSSGTSPSEW